jgi:beta-lactamase regulating signal transducer with metallopeptidase domain
MIADWFAGETVNAPTALALKVMAGASILVLLACLVHAALGRRRALIRSGLWNAVLLALILQPACALGLPRLRIACLPVRGAIGEARLPAGLGSGVERVDGPRAGAMGAPGSRLAAIGPAAEPPSAAATGIPLVPGLVLWCYVLGTSILFIRLIASLGGVARLKRASANVDDPEWSDRLAYWRSRLGIARPVRLLRSATVRIPMVLGWVRPAIIVPLVEEEPDRLPQSRIDAVLLHELAHLRRGDDLWNLLQQLVRVVYWPNPLIWLMDGIIADVREQACDDLCVRWLGSAKRYRTALIAAAMRLVERPSSSAAVPALAMARASSSALLRRLRWIERTPGTTACMLHWPGRVAVLLAVLGVAIGLATIEPARAQPTVPPRAAKLEGGTVRAYDSSIPKSAVFRTVTLTVLDDENSQPLADVEVQILNYIDYQDHWFRTDSRGELKFEYPTLHDNPMGNIEVRKNGYVPLRYGWGWADPALPPEALTLRLRHGITMGGIVVAAVDRPVADVTVVMTVGVGKRGARPANPTGTEIFYEIPLKTGPDGRWRTDSVPPGAAQVHLQLIHPDFVSDGCRTEGAAGRSPKISDLLAQTDRQVLLKGVEIRGRVVDEMGHPIAGANVVDSTRNLVFLDYVWKAVTDADGKFHIHLPRDRVVNLTVQAKGRQPAMQTVTPDPDHADVEFRLPPGKRLRGRVVDPDGNPIADASIHIPPFPYCKGIYFNSRTDAQGRFEWDSAPEEPTSFQIWAAGFLPLDPVRIAASDIETVVTLKRAVDVRFDVVDAQSGKAIPGFLIRIGIPDPVKKEIRWGNFDRKVDTATYHDALDPARGPYEFEITAAGFATTRIHLPAEPMIHREVIRLLRLEEAPGGPPFRK